jgi:hypothetical protein
VRHTVTHRRYETEVWRGKLLGPAPRVARLRWVSRAQPEVAITALAKKAVEAYRFSARASQSLSSRRGLR